MRVRRQVRAKPRRGDDARKSYEMQAKIGAKSIEKSTKSDEKSTKIRSWAVLDVQSRCADASGSARDTPGTVKCVPGAILGRPGRAKRAQEASKGAPERDFQGTGGAFEAVPPPSRRAKPLGPGVGYERPGLAVWKGIQDLT